MKTPITRMGASEERTIRLHGAFTAPGDEKGADTQDLLIFCNLLLEARELEQRARWREVRAKERKLRERSALIPKFVKVLRNYVDGKIDADTVARRIKRICPKGELQKELFEYLVTPATVQATSDKELASEEKAITHGEQILRAWRQSTRSVETLAAQAAAGNKDAIKNLVDVASHAVQSLMIAERSHPEAAQEVARGNLLWPLLASAEPGWESMAAERLRRLELGKDLEILRTSFRAARGTDENYPARKWAKAAVRTLEETRRRYLTYGHHRVGFEELILEQGVDIASSPGWVNAACGLPRLSEATAREWGNVIREMIREQKPDFHTRPEWENQRNTARHSGRGTRGEIQNAILDDIVSALRRIAPVARLPKSTS